MIKNSCNCLRVIDGRIRHWQRQMVGSLGEFVPSFRHMPLGTGTVPTRWGTGTLVYSRRSLVMPV